MERKLLEKKKHVELIFLYQIRLRRFRQDE